MSSRIPACIVLIGLTLGAFAIPALRHSTAQQGPDNKEATSKPNESQEQLRLLDQKISTKDFSEPKKLKRAIELIADQTGGKLSILVDRSVAADLGIELYDMDVSLPEQPDRISIGTAIRLMLASAGDTQATFVIRQGRVEIVSLQGATSKRLLTYPVFATFQYKPLEYALRDLADYSGLTIILDPSVGKKADVEIKGNFRNVALEDALVAVTEMAELKFVVLHQSVYVTTAAKAEVIEKEERKRAERREPLKVKKDDAK